MQKDFLNDCKWVWPQPSVQCQLGLLPKQRAAYDGRGGWPHLHCINLDTVQDFLIKLGIKPRLPLLKISIFSLNNGIVRPTKIIKDLCKAST